MTLNLPFLCDTGGNEVSEDWLLSRALPEPKWEWTFDSDWTFCFRVVSSPNWFHRQTQRLILGIHWRRL